MSSSEKEIKDAEVVVIIPCYQPDNQLIYLLEDFLKLRINEYIVLVNDGSGKEYETVFSDAEQIIGRFGIVLQHEFNIGKGDALKAGFMYVIEHLLVKRNIIGVVTADADGQHSPGAIMKIVELLRKNENVDGIILGIRDFSGSSIPWKSVIGNQLTRKAFKFVTGKKITDTQTGLRGLPIGIVERCINIPGRRFEYETEVLLEVARTGEVIEESIPTIYDSVENHITHFNPIIDSVKIYVVLLKNFVKYSISSILSAVIDLLLFVIFCRWTRSYLSTFYIMVSTVMARILSASFNFITNRKIVFKSEKNFISAASLYLILCIVQMLTSGILVTVVELMFPYNEVLIKIFIDTGLFFGSYYVQQNHIFRGN